jgi:hypothetical protein
VFIIESVLTVVAWPFMHLYTPVVGIPVALYAVTLNRSLKPSLCTLLLSLGPRGDRAGPCGPGWMGIPARARG